MLRLFEQSKKAKFREEFSLLKKISAVKNSVIFSKNEINFPYLVSLADVSLFPDLLTHHAQNECYAQ